MFRAAFAIFIGSALAQPPLFGPPPPFGPPPNGRFPPPQFGSPPQNGQFGSMQGWQIGPAQNAHVSQRPQNGAGGFGGPPNGFGGRGPLCHPDDPNSATLPECMNQFFSNGMLLDGNGRTCNRQGTISAKLDRATLLQRAEDILRTGTCQREETGPPMGGGAMGGGWMGRPGRRKRQLMSFGQTCSGFGIGNCESRSQRLESIYVEKDLGDRLLIIANGIPDHCYHDGAVAPTPNVACEHYRMMVIPKNPRKLNDMIAHGMGPVGIAKSGAFFYNHLSAGATCSVAAVSEKATFDACDGHADPMCRYHYHKAPNCMPGFDECALLGYNSDGFPIYGECSVGGLPMKSCYRKTAGKNGCDPTHYTYDPSTPGCNLDKANGYTFSMSSVTSGGTRFQAGQYAYFFTPDYPFIMPGIYGDKSQTQWCVISP